MACLKLERVKLSEEGWGRLVEELDRSEEAQLDRGEKMKAGLDQSDGGAELDRGEVKEKAELDKGEEKEAKLDRGEETKEVEPHRGDEEKEVELDKGEEKMEEPEIGEETKPDRGEEREEESDRREEKSEEPDRGEDKEPDRGEEKNEVELDRGEEKKEAGFCRGEEKEAELDRGEKAGSRVHLTECWPPDPTVAALASMTRWRLVREEGFSLNNNNILLESVNVNSNQKTV